MLNPVPRKRSTTMLAWLILALSASASAQQPAAPPSPPGTSPPPPTQPALQGPRVASPAEMLKSGTQVVRRGESTGRSVRRMLEVARKAADIIRVTCLNDKLTQINANLKTAQSRLTALQAAVDPDRRAHEYTVLSVLGQKLQVLDREAQQCVGQGMYDTGETKVITEIDPDMLPFEENPSSPPVLLPPSLSNVLPPATGFR